MQWETRQEAALAHARAAQKSADGALAATVTGTALWLKPQLLPALPAAEHTLLRDAVGMLLGLGIAAMAMTAVFVGRAVRQLHEESETAEADDGEPKPTSE